MELVGGMQPTSLYIIGLNALFCDAIAFDPVL